MNSSFTRYAPGLSSEYRDNLPAQIGVLTDGSAMKAITAYTDSFVDYLPTSIGYHLIENPKVLVINSGAGQDVMVALQKNASVVALETNPIIIKLVSEDYKELSGDIYNKAEVNIGYGRSFIKKEDKYDIIIISLAR